MRVCLSICYKRQHCLYHIQYTAEAVAGVILDHMHKQLGKAIKRKNKQKPVTVEVGSFKIDNLRDLARGKRGRKAA